MKNYIETHKTSFFFLLALILTWVIWIPMALNQLGIIDFNIPIIIGQSAGALMPLLVLFLLNKFTNGALGVKSIFDSIRIKGEKIFWLIPAALILPTMAILGNLLNFLFGNEAELKILSIELLNNLGLWLIIIIPLTFFASLLSSPFFEEPCWRGFGLNPLQSRFGKHLGSLLLGSFWWLWHQPINITNGLDVNLYSYLYMVSQSFIFDSLYNLSNRNLLNAMFAHSSAIIRYNYIYQSDNLYVLLLLIITIIALRIIEYRRKSKITVLQPDFQLKNQKNEV